MFDYQTQESLVPEAITAEEVRTRGCCKGYVIRPGFELILADVHHESEAVYRHECSGSLKFHYKLAGDSFISGEGEDYVAVDVDRMSYLVLPNDSIKHSRTPADTRERSVTLACNRDFATSIFSDLQCGLPQAIGEFCSASPSRFHFAAMFLPSQMRIIVQDLLELTQTGTMQTGTMESLLLESKALELLYFTGKQLQSSATAATVRHRDEQKVRILCEMLESKPAADLSIATLCKELAWNERQMLECFKLVTGMTISDYRSKARMTDALQQLQSSTASITEIALNTGYEYPGNFATAFKRTFGFSPKAARERLGR